MSRGLRRLNIIRVVEKFPPLDKAFGLAPAILDISKGQISQGHKVSIICKSYPGQPRVEKNAGLEVHRVNPPFNLSSLRKVIELRDGASIVHTHATAGLSIPAFKRLFLGFSLRHVAHVHGTSLGIQASWGRHGVNRRTFLQRLFTRWTVFRERFMWRSADAVIAVSDHVRQELIQLYHVDEWKVHVVPNGVDLGLFSPVKKDRLFLPTLGLPRDSELILYLGEFRAVKGVETLIRALRLVKDSRPKARAIVVGGKTTGSFAREIIELIHSLKLDDMVSVKGLIPHDSLPRLYNTAQVVVIPSIYDSAPKVALEAMACGTPVVATRVGGLQEFLKEGSGILVEPRDHVQLAEEIIRLLNDPQLAIDIGNRGRDRAVERYSWDRAVSRIEQAYGRAFE